MINIQTNKAYRVLNHAFIAVASRGCGQEAKHNVVILFSNLWNESCIPKTPEKDLCPQVVPNAVEVVLVKQGLTDGPLESPVGQMGEDLFSERTKTPLRSQLRDQSGWVDLHDVFISTHPLTWSSRTQTWCRAPGHAASCRWAANCQTCVCPQSSALGRAFRWKRNANGHVSAALPLMWIGNSRTYRSGKRCPWVALCSPPWHRSSWVLTWAWLPSPWKQHGSCTPHRWRTHHSSCWPGILWLGLWTLLPHTLCWQTDWPSAALVLQACWQNNEWCRSWEVFCNGHRKKDTHYSPWS